ncbi:hypothetical protein [Rubrivirga sp.]|uniref:hypothetical protein n=1 Tax=Rubrivirga sp. TaxID=1885344 RepID=UPI003B520AF6
MPRLVLVAAALWAVSASAQIDEGLLPLDDPVHRFLQHQQTAGALDGALLTTLPLSAYEARRMLDTLATRVEAGDVRLGTADRARLDRFRGVAPAPGAEWARRRLGSSVYGDGETLLAADGDGYAVRAQPLLYLTPGLTRRTERPDRDARIPTYRLSRGVGVAGHAGPVFFDATVLENQERPAEVEWESFTAPRLGFTKLIGDDDVYDYIAATGVVGFTSRFFEVRAGRERANWGFGEGSLELADYTAPQDHVEIRARFWRVRYTNRYSRRVRPVERVPGDPQLYPRSYSALHQLAIDLPGGVQAELFEIVAFADDSTGGARRGFEPAYLNPFVLYRAVEGDLGTFDNALLGVGLAWNAAPGYRAYGQLLIDELRFSELGNDWWGNKWGVLVGAHVVDPGWGDARLRGLSLRAEYARQRPYLYTHRSESSAYVHYGDGLGHPAGPNTSDLSTWALYAPLPRLEVGLHVSHTVRGRNTATENFGSDPTLTYDTRTSNYGVETLQGVRQRETILEAWTGVEVLPEAVLGVGLTYRGVDDDGLGRDRAVTGFAQLRWGLPYQTRRF